MGATDHIKSLSSWQRRCFQAILTFYALGAMVVTVLALALLTLFLVAIGVLLSALHQVGAAIAQTWTESGAIEHLVMLVLAWLFLSWLIRFYRRVKA